MRPPVAPIVLLALALSGGVAAAAPEPDPTGSKDPMRVVLVRDARPDCEPDCQEWISAEGDFVRETPAAFRRMFKTIGKRQLPIFIDSAGGYVEASLEVGRMLRARKAVVAVQRTEFDGCQPADTPCPAPKNGAPYRGTPLVHVAKCASACVFALAGAERRVVGRWSIVAVHQVRTVARTLRQFQVRYRIENGRKIEIARKLVSERTVAVEPKAEGADAAAYKPIVRYLKEMGITDRLMPLITGTPASSIRVMTRDELTATRVATEFAEPVALVRPTLPAPPANVVAVGKLAEIPILLELGFNWDGKAPAAQWTAQIGPEPVLRRLTDPVAYLQPAGAGSFAAMRPSDAAAPNGPLTGTLPIEVLCTAAGATGAVELRLEFARGPKARTETFVVGDVAVPALAELRSRACRRS